MWPQAPMEARLRAEAARTGRLDGFAERLTGNPDTATGMSVSRLVFPAGGGCSPHTVGKPFRYLRMGTSAFFA